jgi:hypothetical protein
VEGHEEILRHDTRAGEQDHQQLNQLTQSVS